MDFVYIVYAAAAVMFCVGTELLLFKSGFSERLPDRGYIAALAAAARKKHKHRLATSKLMKRMRYEKNDKEVYEAMAFIRNFTAATGGNVRSEFILEQLAARESPLKTSYLKALGLMRLNKVKEAECLLGEDIGTEAGRSLASLIVNWDMIKPEELTEILETRSKSIREIYITKAKRREEILSDVIYFPVVINVFVIFVNFIYVGYFMQQKEMLSILF